jgi:hypothetical protein
MGPAGGIGADGAQGPAGQKGETGAAGPAGTNGLSQFAYVFNLAAQTVALEAAVTFDSNGVMTPGIKHAAGSAGNPAGDAGIEFVEAGIYEVTFSVSGTEPNQMALFLNGTPVPGTTYGSGAGTQPNTGQAIFAISAADVLTVRNHTSAAAVGLASLIGGTRANSNASVVIEKLG